MQLIYALIALWMLLAVNIFSVVLKLLS